MRRFVLWGPGLALFALALALTGWMPGGVSPASARTNCDAPDSDNSAMELQLLTLLNAERAKGGAQALKLSPGLNRSAAWKSHDSSAAGPGFSHTDSLGRDVNTRAQQCDYGRYMGENIAYGFPSAQTVFNAWMGSSGHKANMLNGSWSMAGIGEYQTRWTLDFGTLDDSGPPSSNSTATPTAVSPTATATRPPSSPTPTPVTVTAAGIQIWLSEGFNLVTYAGAAQPTAHAIASLTTSVVAVYEWDPATESWRRFIADVPAYVNTLGSLRPGWAYFVVMSKGAIWSY